MKTLQGIFIEQTGEKSFKIRYIESWGSEQFELESRSLLSKIKMLIEKENHEYLSKPIDNNIKREKTEC